MKTLLIDTLSDKPQIRIKPGGFNERHSLLKSDHIIESQTRRIDNQYYNFIICPERQGNPQEGISALDKKDNPIFREIIAIYNHDQDGKPGTLTDEDINGLMILLGTIRETGKEPGINGW